MRAYNLAMVLIFINCGFVVAGSIGIFGDIGAGNAGGLLDLVTAEVSIMGFSFSSIHAFALLLVTGSLLVLNTKIGPSSSGYAYAIFTIVFWFGNLSTHAILTTAANKAGLPGFGIFLAIFHLAALLIFVNALVQMPTGGQKSHV